MPPTEVSIALGHVIRTLRESAEMSQEDLGFQAGRHRTFVSLIERGVSNPTVGTLWLLAHALGVRPSEIVARVEMQVDEPPERRA